MKSALLHAAVAATYCPGTGGVVDAISDATCGIG